MSNDQVNPYEGLFLFPQQAMSNLQGAVDHLRSILERAEVQIISLKKWDERRLAYEIKGNKRGVYFLVYFKAQPEKLTQIDRDCNLSEELLRVLVTRADHIPMEQMEAADGQAELADEIRLRAEADDVRAAEAAKVAAAADSKAEAEAAAEREAADEDEPAVVGADSGYADNSEAEKG